MTTFCDNDPSDPDTLHNDEAPSEQNAMCDGNSTWEVMRQHSDFKDGQLSSLYEVVGNILYACEPGHNHNHHDFYLYIDIVMFETIRNVTTNCIQSKM